MYFLCSELFVTVPLLHAIVLFFSKKRGSVSFYHNRKVKIKQIMDGQTSFIVKMKQKERQKKRKRN